jgi:SAM-dependent methyltransferase
MTSDRPPLDVGVRLADFAVASRTALLRLLSPFERLGRVLGDRAGVREPLPPLWLRRHAGPIRAFRTSGDQAMEHLERMGLLRPDLRILDFGCGPGSLVPRFARVLGSEGRYLGLDLHGPSIAWCRRSYIGDVRFAFERLDPLAPRPWPVAEGSFDLILAKSVFTHLLEAEARSALSEIRRTLAPGGCAMVTVFLFDGAGFTNRALPWFPCPGPAAPVRWRRASRPTAAVAVEAEVFRAWISRSGLHIDSMLAGYHPGGAEPPTGQDTLFLMAGGDRSKG